MTKEANTLKAFNSIEEAKEYGKNFSKHQYETVLINGKRKILCGTDMAYEEDIWGSINEILELMYEKFVTPEMEEEKDDGRYLLVDKTSELRDEIISWFEKIMNVEFIDVYDEY